MRIVCPRCVAQYEVDESAIPEAGREVQCANCGNVWFQDYIEMLPNAADEDMSDAEADAGVFDDLDGKSEANFYSSRGAGQVDGTPDTDQDFEDDETTDLLSDDDDSDEETAAPNIPIPPVDEDVLDVLRSEAAFSSVRDKLDDATAAALDDDLTDDIEETVEQAVESVAEEVSDAAQTAAQDIEDETPDVEIDDLTAFLDAHTEEPEDDSPAPEQDEESAVEVTDPSADFDPLADLDAIRSQLDDIGTAEAEPNETSEYTPVLPIDDPIVSDDSSDAAVENLDTVEGQTDGDDVADDISTDALRAAIDGATTDDAVGDLDDNFEDDFDEDRPRHAYRADGEASEDTLSEDAIPETAEDDDLAAELAASASDTDTPDTDAEPEKDTDNTGALAAVAVAGTAAAAVGLTRPRSSGKRTRARSLPGFDATPQKTDTPDVPADDLSAAIANAVEDAPNDIGSTLDDAIDLPDLEDDTTDRVAKTDRKADPSRRPKADRKAMLPDVEELDASLRSDEEPRRRDREMMEAHEEALAKANKGGFRRAFIWTLLIIAVLIALYVLRPQLVAALPAAAVVLDPYASAIDSLRAMIEGFLG